MNSGFIQLHRKLLENPIFNKPGLLQLFIYCLLKANHKTNEFIFNDELIKIERGSFLTGRKILSSELRCKEATLYRRLQILKDFDYISIKTTNKYSIISVINYNKYQTTVLRLKPKNERKSNNKKDLKSIDNIEVTEKELKKCNNKVTTNEQQNNTNNNDNNDNNVFSDKDLLKSEEELTKEYIYRIALIIAEYRNETKPGNQIYKFINRIINTYSVKSIKKYQVSFMFLVYVLRYKDKFNGGLPFAYFNSFFPMLYYSDFRREMFNSTIKQSKEEVFN